MLDMEELSDNQEGAVPAIMIENEEDGLSSATGFESTILDDTTGHTYHDNEKFSQVRFNLAFMRFVLCIYPLHSVLVVPMAHRSLA